jgi:hypothetical protein
MYKPTNLGISHGRSLAFNSIQRKKIILNILLIGSFFKTRQIKDIEYQKRFVLKYLMCYLKHAIYDGERIMKFYLVVLGIVLVVTGGELLEILQFSANNYQFLTPLGHIGYEILKVFNYANVGEVVVTGIFLFIMGLLFIIIGAAPQHHGA